MKNVAQALDVESRLRSRGEIDQSEAALGVFTAEARNDVGLLLQPCQRDEKK